ncbi:MAG: aspartate/glutamate racemase family protein [Proteobacteria bacterium]|nr:aspartate/glutamate racemase family protein [Pseudomonadota bacterium]
MPLHVKRVGVLLPPNDVTLEYEFFRFAPPGVTTHFHRLRRSSSVLTAESLLEMVDSLEERAKEITHVHPDVIVYGCTSGSLLGGPDRHRELGERIRACTGIPGLTTASAVIEALAALAARRVFVATPYPEAINRSLVAFLAHHGHETVGLTSFLFEHGDRTGYVESAETAALVRASREAIRGADAVFVSCTNLRAMDQVEALEGELGLPVVTSNQATLWAALRTIGVETAAIRAGRLFRLDRRPAGRSMA